MRWGELAGRPNSSGGLEFFSIKRRGLCFSESRPASFVVFFASLARSVLFFFASLSYLSRWLVAALVCGSGRGGGSLHTSAAFVT